MNEEVIDGLHFFRTPFTRNSMAQLPGLNEIALMRHTARRIEQVVNQVNPEVIHAHSPVLNALPAIWVGRRTKIPVVYEVRAFWEDGAVDHGTTQEGSLRYRLTHGLETYALKHVGAITAICEGLRGDIVSRGIPADRVTVIPNGVNVDDFSSDGVVDEDLKQRLGLRGARILGYIGSFYGYEGLDVLLNALPAILQRSPDVRLLLAGGGPQESALKEQTRMLGLEEKIVFAGRVPHSDVKRYYSLIDVLVYPRRSNRLTELVTPMKPLEAMAMGKSLIASDVGGHRELLGSTLENVMFHPGDAADLTRVVLELMGDPARSAALRHTGLEYVKRERDWRDIVQRYRTVYERQLKSPLPKEHNFR